MHRVLLDTNIIIHRETSKVIKDDIGKLFNWLDRLNYTKVVNSISIEEIKKYQDQDIVDSFEIKMESYEILETDIPWDKTLKKFSDKYDSNQNSINDSILINDFVQGRADLIITEDKGIHKKADILGIAEYIYTVTDFIEKVTIENPGLAEYDVLSIKKERFGNIDIHDPFFDSFKQDYKGFKKWFFSKSEKEAYVCYSDDELVAFLYLKTEGLNENYNDITPTFSPAKRLKVGTFKVVLNGFKIGERFMKIIFDNAIQNQVDQIYLTIFGNTFGQKQLIGLLEEWGFTKHGIKKSTSGIEKVFVRNFSRRFDSKNPQLTYPYFNLENNIFIVPIYPEYHTELIPDSILTTEENEDYVEHKPYRYAIRKVYISRSIERNLNSGDIIVFYRTGSNRGPAHYTSVATTVGIIQSKSDNIKSLKNFINLCRKRSIFDDSELKEYWDWNKNNRPFVVNFLYVHSFANRLTLKELKENNIIDSAPRGFEKMSKAQFKKLYELSNGDQRLIVN